MVLAYLSYRTAGTKSESKLYDPFEILGLSTGVSEKEIKAHFKNLARIL